jgi:hypothetical protein
MVAPEIVTMQGYRDDGDAGIGAPDAAGGRGQFHRRGVAGRGRRRSVAVAHARHGRVVHSGRAHRLARPPGRAGAVLPVGSGRICIGRAAQPQAIYPGDTVMIPPDTTHWHEAAADRLFSHLAMSESGEGGEGTDWAEHVSDEDYNKPAAP